MVYGGDREGTRKWYYCCTVANKSIGRVLHEFLIQPELFDGFQNLNARTNTNGFSQVFGFVGSGRSYCDRD